MVGQTASLQSPTTGIVEPGVPPCPEAGRVERVTDRWAIRVDGWEIALDRADVARATPLFRYQPAQRPKPPARVVSRRKLPADCTSPYDDLFAKYAVKHGLDWRFVLAVAFQESGFQPSVEGDGGAYGLMQVTPIAAREVGEEAIENPEHNIRAGVRYLELLSKIYPRARGRDRMALTLAAYNIGPGHVRDAQLLAERFGYDPNRWDDSLEAMLPLLEESAFYSELPGGFARGRRGVDYVNRVMDRYDRYCMVLGAVPTPSRAVD